MRTPEWGKGTTDGPILQDGLTGHVFDNGDSILPMRSSSTRWFIFVASITCRKFWPSERRILYLSVALLGLLAVLEVLYPGTFLMESNCTVGFEFQSDSSSLSPELSLW